MVGKSGVIAVTLTPTLAAGSAKSSALHKLRIASRRLLKPQLASALTLWVARVEGIHHAMEAKALEKERVERDEELSALHDELSALRTHVNAVQSAADNERQRALERLRIKKRV